MKDFIDRNIRTKWHEALVSTVLTITPGFTIDPETNIAFCVYFNVIRLILFQVKYKFQENNSLRSFCTGYYYTARNMRESYRCL